MKRAGFGLIQVLILMAVVATLFALVLPVALRSSKVANSSAAVTLLDALVTRAKFALADAGIDPDSCVNLLKLSGPTFPAAAALEVQILDPNAAGTIIQGQAFGPGFVQLPEFTITSASLQIAQIFGDAADKAVTAAGVPVAGTQTRYLANIVVKGALNSTGGMANFLGSSTIQENIPIFLQASGGVIQFCSTRSKYLIALGPVAGAGKSALECLDIDGIPVQVGAAPNSYWVCQLPYSNANASAGMFPNNCQTAAPGPQSILNIENAWVPDPNLALHPPPANYQYCI